MSRLLMVATLGLALGAVIAISTYGSNKGSESERPIAQETHIVIPPECGEDYWNPEKAAA